MVLKDVPNGLFSRVSRIPCQTCLNAFLISMAWCVHWIPETLNHICCIHARAIGCEIQHEKRILGLSNKGCHGCYPPAVRAGEAATFGQCEINYFIASSQISPVPFDVFAATVKQSLFIGTRFLNKPYSRDLRMRRELDQRSPYGVVPKFAFICDTGLLVKVTLFVELRHETEMSGF